jgi:hypothetical protein
VFAKDCCFRYDLHYSFKSPIKSSIRGLQPHFVKTSTLHQLPASFWPFVCANVVQHSEEAHTPRLTPCDPHDPVRKRSTTADASQIAAKVNE